MALLADVVKHIFVFIFMVLWSFVTLLGVLFQILTHPIESFKTTPRNVPPACLLDSSLGSHEYVTANGIKFHCVTAGDKSKPLVLFLHGFPEFWFCWRYQLREFSKDYRVVAIDMRGYGETDRPPNKLDYQMKHLIKDIAELVPALGYSSCILVAHDWGGGVAWNVVMAHAELVDRLVIMNSPHPKVMLKHMRGKQFLMSWYIFMFQMPWLPEFVIRLRDFKSLDGLSGTKHGVRNKANFSQDVLEAYKYTFSQPGALTGPINHYRCIFKEDVFAKAKKKTPIQVPTLVIWGDEDTALSKEMADDHSTVCTNVTVR